MRFERAVREECAELVRQGYEALNRGELGTIREMIHPDLHCDPPAGVLDARQPSGPRGFDGFMRELSRDWDDFHCELEEVRHAGELLVALVLEEGRERGSGEWKRRQVFHIWTVRGRQAVRFGRHARVTSAAAA